MSNMSAIAASPQSAPEKWTAEKKLWVLAVSHGLAGVALRSLLRHEGVCEEQLAAWRATAARALEEPESHDSSARMKREARRRGRYIPRAEREATLARVKHAMRAGIPLKIVCEQLGVSPRTIQRWRKPETAEDRRGGSRQQPPNRLSQAERESVLRVAHGEEFRGLSPKQIVPRLADAGVYLASESTFSRVLNEAAQGTHRGQARPPARRQWPKHMVSAPNQAWSWDITYLKGPVRGSFFYLYMVVDVYSRRVMGWEVHEEESSEKAAALILRCWQEAERPEGLMLRSDNGGPMKGATLLATLRGLGVIPSFSRPRVSNDNPFSEALFRTLKARPSFPSRPFDSLAQARTWVASFVGWYNTEHRHSAIRFVTPDDRHFGQEAAILEKRRQVYQQACSHHPERWHGPIRNWTPAGPVHLPFSVAQASPPGGIGRMLATSLLTRTAGGIPAPDLPVPG